MSSGQFEAALEIVLRFEGGYVDHPADPGGATNLGITLATLSAWRGRSVSKAEVRALTKLEAGKIYRARYWDAVQGDALPPGLDLAMFDYAVNSGPARAIRALQGVLGVARDGQLGPMTLGAIATQTSATHPSTTLSGRLCAERRAYLEALKIFPIFGKGWLRRVATVEAEASRMAAKTPTSPLSQQEKTMDLTKTIFASRTLWANAIGLIAVGLSAFGFDTSTLDAGTITDQVFQGIAAGSFIISSVFRVLASKRLV